MKTCDCMSWQICSIHCAPIWVSNIQRNIWCWSIVGVCIDTFRRKWIFSTSLRLVWHIGMLPKLSKCYCNLHETNGWHISYIHQLICSSVLGWHPDIQPDLGRAPPPHPTGPPNIVAAQFVCQFGQVHFWNDPSLVSGIHYWWVWGTCGSNQDTSHSGLANPNYSNRASHLFGPC